MSESAQSNQTFSSDQPNKVYTTNPGKVFGLVSTRALVLALVGLGLAAGLFVAGVQYQLRSEDPAVQALKKSSPLPLDLITNSVIVDWRGLISGKVIGVNTTNTTLIVEKDGELLTIKAVSPLTKVHELTSADDPQSTTSKEISFSEIPVNAEITGEVWLPVTGRLPASGTPGDVVAKVIFVYKK